MTKQEKIIKNIKDFKIIEAKPSFHFKKFNHYVENIGLVIYRMEDGNWDIAMDIMEPEIETLKTFRGVDFEDAKLPLIEYICENWEQKKIKFLNTKEWTLKCWKRELENELEKKDEIIKKIKKIENKIKE